MNTWQPIETAPYDTKILVHGGELNNDLYEPIAVNSPVKVIRRERKYADEHSFKVCDTVYYDVWVENPTHWMQLPEPPIN